MDCLASFVFKVLIWQRKSQNLFRKRPESALKTNRWSGNPEACRKLVKKPLRKNRKKRGNLTISLLQVPKYYYTQSFDKFETVNPQQSHYPLSFSL